MGIPTVLYLFVCISLSGAFAPVAPFALRPSAAQTTASFEVATSATAGDDSTTEGCDGDDDNGDSTGNTAAAATDVAVVNATTNTESNATMADDYLKMIVEQAGGIGQWLSDLQESNDKLFNEWNAALTRKPLALGVEFPNLVGSTQSTDEFDLYEYLGNDSWGVVFMHPGDYTPVCSTELGKAAELESEFEARNAKLCGFSCNDKESHIGWIEDIKSLTGSQVQFPIFCDPDRTAAIALGILDDSNRDTKGLPLTVRSVFILKPDKTIALMITYPASTGRNFDEILRALDALQLTTDCSVATPVDWEKGDEVIVNFPLSNAEATEKFGKDGYRVVEVPSEQGKDLEKNYLRYTKDPSASESGFRKVIHKIPFLKRL